ncbi:MAG TPA: flagellar motor switch protein FliN [Solirubrobacteraceae bacterium]|jgi:flagellar motor switch protein FliN/FliY|nr:flagellar motor switch protein FliN [Solirubrobacteraceae bacterium]
MSEAVAYEQLDQSPEPAETVGIRPTPEAGADLRRLSDVLMELSVEIGRTRMTVGEMLQLRAGSIVTLERLAGEPVDLLVNGTPIARGEVVIVDEQFGLRVTEIVEGDAAAADLDEPDDGAPLNAGPTAPPDVAPPGAGGDRINADSAVQG